MHFTYEPSLDRGSLQQGDILRRTAAIDAVLADVHPHYTKSDYSYLMVLTQTCDLVRRYGEHAAPRCKARYISVAAVRPLELVLSREIGKFQRDPMEQAHRLCVASHRDKVHQFVERLFNNNEEDYFYLHPFQYQSQEFGLVEPHCAFLALSIALKSEFHYDTCLTAKILQLNESFQHKLGWLTGKMYSRIGTEDWVPDTCTADDFDQRIAALLNEACVWIEPLLRAKLQKRVKDIPDAERTTDRVLAEYEKMKSSMPKKKELFLERLVEILKEHALDDTLVRRIKNMVMSDPVIAGYIAK